MSKRYERLISSSHAKEYDWVNGGVKPTVTVVSNTLVERGGMPINQENKRKQGVFPPGGSWFAWRYVVENGINPLGGTIWRPGFGRACEGTPVVTEAGGPAGWDTYYTGSVIANIRAAVPAYMADGHSKAKPAQPVFDGALFLGELKDVPNAIKQTIYAFIGNMARRKPHWRPRWSRKGVRWYNTRSQRYVSTTAEWYLAIQMGWLPTLKDILEFCTSFDDAKKRLEFTLRNEGKWVKRKYDLEGEEGKPLFAPQYTKTNYGSYNGGLRPSFVTQCYSGGGWKEFKYVGTRKVQYVAKYRYVLPKGPRDAPWRKMMQRRLYGMRLTPSLVWNLIPFSWLVDYFTNMGKIMKNLSSGMEDRLITKYRYVLIQDKREYEIRCSFTCNSAGDRKVAWAATKRFTLECKSRFTGGPYGFALKEDDLNIRQKSILLALGLKA